MLLENRIIVASKYITEDLSTKCGKKRTKNTFRNFLIFKTKEKF